MIHKLIERLDPSPAPKLAFPRCEHRSPAGRQCSQPICSTSPHFCFNHKPDPNQQTIDELTEAAGSLSTPEEIHAFLTRVTLLRVQGRITPKEAGNYAFLCQILQRGQREIAFHQKLRDERAAHEAQQSRPKDSFGGWHLPRPKRDAPSDTPAQPAPTHVVAAPTTPDPAPSPVPPPAATPAESLPSTASTQSPTVAEEISPEKKSTRTKKSAPPAPAPLPPDFYNHFHPIDPSLPHGHQDLTKNIPHPDAAECARRNARRGFVLPRPYRKAASRFFGLWR